MIRLRIFEALTLWIVLIEFASCQTEGPEQVQIPIGAYRVFKKTSFSCLGRPAGYYADIETGCQVYHMCDGLGRQFSYSCPNTTLFQQRMLICDHWYMVNCSRAESDYAANLLIGQRDKPFVPEEENQLRTPRPDLLDRPYAPDYSGESFRNQYKQFPSIHNQIIDYNSEKFHKPTATRWRIQRPSPEILPPAQQEISRRNDDMDEISPVDLGTSFSSNYNSSGDFSAEKTTSEKSADSNIIIPDIKVPSKLYEPPFAYPVWNENYTAEVEEETSTKILATTTQFTTFPTVPTTSKPLTRPSTVAGRPFTSIFFTTTTPFPTTVQAQTEITDNIQQVEVSTFGKSTHRDYDFSKYSTSALSESQDIADRRADVSSISSTNVFLSTTPVTTTTYSSVNEDKSEFDLPGEDRLLQPSPFSLKIDSDIPQPSVLILPPFSEFVSHDIATTQGPPIYYEWKIPSNALEPPKLDPPVGVDGRKEDGSVPENDSLSTASSFVDSTSSNKPRPFSHNPFLSPIVNKSQRSVTSSTKTPTPRSIQQAPAHTNFLTDNETKEINKTFSNESSTEKNIEQLRKDLHVPDFLFPLENDGRTGYEHTDTVNSFQIKIPERRSGNKRWYGENPDCPECHPTFLKPGTCEPCVRRR